VSRTGLGKGLSALIPMEAEMIGREDKVAEVEIGAIHPNPFQPRRHFDEDKLSELAESIREHGVLQPVIVRAVKPVGYELVVGERRLRACQLLKLEKIPAVIKEFTNQEMMEIALIENIQRQDLNPIEEAAAYKRLLEEFGLTQEQLAQRLSKSRSLIANMVRLLNLPEQILDKVANGHLTVGHVRPLLTVENEEIQLRLAREMIEKTLTVREAEALARAALESKPQGETKKERPREERLSPLLQDIESRLRDLFGTKVKIKSSGEKGKIEIDYYSSDDLERITAIFIKEGL